MRVTKYLGVKDGKEQNKSITLHNYILDIHPGKGKYCIDHINHDSLDNRRENLRVTEMVNNTKNRESKNKNNKTGYRNVFWNTGIQKWTVSLSMNYKQIHIGDYNNVDEAGRIAEKARQKYYGKYAGGN